jgi:SAM-dependent methyltransferase
MKGVELWERTYKDKWFKEAIAWSNKLGLSPQSLSPIPEDGLYHFVIEIVKRHVPRGAKVLDAGAGTLDFSVLLAEEGYKVIAVEINDKMLELSKVHRPLPAGVIPVRSDFRSLHIRFDAVVMLNSSWVDEIPKNWCDKVIITDAWWNGLKGRVTVMKDCRVVSVYEKADRNEEDEPDQGKGYDSFSYQGDIKAVDVR